TPGQYPLQINIADDSAVQQVPEHHPRVIIHAGSGGYSTARRWDAANFAAVANALHQQHNAQIILVGTADDNTDAVLRDVTVPYTDLSGQTTLASLYSLLKTADLFVGADSGVMHL